MKAKKLTQDEQREALQRLFHSLRFLHSREPELTLTGLLGLLDVALETMGGDIKRMPRLGHIAQRLDMSQSGASRLMATLSRGRGTRGTVRQGLGLVITNDWVEGRRPDGYVLTEQGREHVARLISDITGREPDKFEPLDEGAFEAAMLAKP